MGPRGHNKTIETQSNISFAITTSYVSEFLYGCCKSYISKWFSSTHVCIFFWAHDGMAVNLLFLETHSPCALSFIRRWSGITLSDHKSQHRLSAYECHQSWQSKIFFNEAQAVFPHSGFLLVHVSLVWCSQCCDESWWEICCQRASKKRHVEEMTDALWRLL